VLVAAAGRDRKSCSGELGSVGAQYCPSPEQGQAGYLSVSTRGVPLVISAM